MKINNIQRRINNIYYTQARTYVDRIIRTAVQPTPTEKSITFLTLNDDNCALLNFTVYCYFKGLDLGLPFVDYT